MTAVVTVTNYTASPIDLMGRQIPARSRIELWDGILCADSNEALADLIRLRAKEQGHTKDTGVTVAPGRMS